MITRTVLCVLFALFSARVYAQEVPLQLNLPDEWFAKPNAALNAAGQVVITTNLGQVESRQGWRVSAAFRSTYLMGAAGQQLMLSAERALWYGKVNGGMNISRRGTTSNVGYAAKVAEVVDLNAAAWYWRPYGQPGAKPQGVKTFSASMPLAEGLTLTANMAKPLSATIAVDCRKPCWGLQWRIPL